MFNIEGTILIDASNSNDAWEKLNEFTESKFPKDELFHIYCKTLTNEKN